jgi:2-phosphosulfolactate phosphatase
MTAFDQRDAACRCEWGAIGAEGLAPADVTIVVDVLSFCTCVDVAVSRGVTVLPYPWKDISARRFAQEHGAELAGVRGESLYSLSPESFLHAPSGGRCVLPSPNGAELTLRAARSSPIVLAGCLRNASAVARVAQQMGPTFNVCPAGERWPDGTLRPAIEDWLGAGAILCELPGTRSSEAAAAVAMFEQCRDLIAELVAHAASGRELIERGFRSDVELATQIDVSVHVPRFDGLAFTAG